MAVATDRRTSNQGKARPKMAQSIGHKTKQNRVRYVIEDVNGAFQQFFL